MAGHKIAHAILKGPSVVKEICIGLGCWRHCRQCYDLLEKGEISIVAKEEE
ncbi:hypothetical protein MKW98_007976 [Papaver atlanticum]|uniref:Uncharacterized protein n=1 Tax=Papaver atlanticum TaxID=357466 RepID=A0AAD4S5Z8_9MAGN|nr:hypothetical protein MKW98_007976 [Papaver atlanticum]